MGSRCYVIRLKAPYDETDCFSNLFLLHLQLFYQLLLYLQYNILPSN